MSQQSAEVSVLATDQARGVYFWKSCGVQLGSHVTKFTPKWCEACGWAFAGSCPCAEDSRVGSSDLRAPFPWFGGKRRVVEVVWRAFGPDVPNVIDPFMGSCALLLGRPGGAGKIETVNDRDRYLANFYRAVIADPWAVAEWADGPVNEADLHARHKWLVNQAEFRERMHVDPDFYDVKIAGWWVWGICQWIGGGWCVEPQNHKHPKLDGIGKGVHSQRGQRSEADDRKRPVLDGTSPGRGVHSDTGHEPPHEWEQRPHMSGTSDGVGVHRKLPNLAVGGANGDAAGRGILSEAAVREQSRQLPSLRVDAGASGNGVHASGSLADAYSSGRRHALSSAGQGVHLPSLGNDRGIHGQSTTPGTFLHSLRELSVPDAPPCFAWFSAIALRMRRVRVACGDWRRVLGNSVLGKGKNVGGRRPCAVFLDPPYSHEFRDPYLYSEDDANVSAQVREWALERGDDPDLRIALCGYAGEHEMPASWREHEWKAARGYASEGNDNRERERIWFSPHCLPLDAQRSLFGEVGT